MLRVFGLIWLFLFLIWLPIEDTRTGIPLALSTLGVGWLFFQKVAPAEFETWKLAGYGSLAGLAAILGALALFAFKSGLHAHGFSDFNLAQVLNVVALTPLAMLAGAAYGFLLANSAKI